ncbi:hypothetical protein [Salmonella enterica]|uniref:hypothetical protein n=1 Tax=Salmonella enterica TaxID=28901 RepID=UPI00398C2966
MSKNTPSAANSSAYADIVRELAAGRDMIAVAQELADNGYGPHAPTTPELTRQAQSHCYHLC